MDALVLEGGKVHLWRFADWLQIADDTLLIYLRKIPFSLLATAWTRVARRTSGIDGNFILRKRELSDWNEFVPPPQPYLILHSYDVGSNEKNCRGLVLACYLQHIHFNSRVRMVSTQRSDNAQLSCNKRDKKWVKAGLMSSVASQTTDSGIFQSHPS